MNRKNIEHLPFVFRCYDLKSDATEKNLSASGVFFRLAFVWRVITEKQFEKRQDIFGGVFFQGHLPKNEFP